MNKNYSEACIRNQGPISDVLAGIVPTGARIWELGAGTGQHTVAFARRLQPSVYQPTERGTDFSSIEAWIADEGVPAIQPPRSFDLFDEEPPIFDVDVLLAINVLHIAPPEATRRLFVHASRACAPGGIVFTYGPWFSEHRETAPSNLEFHAWLQSRDQAMGLRVDTAVDVVAASEGWRLAGDVDMPANNRSRWWIREGSP